MLYYIVCSCETRSNASSCCRIRSFKSGTHLNLLLDTADYFLLLVSEFKKLPVHRVGTAAINLSQLFWTEKLFLLDINGSYACRSRGHRRCDQLRRAHGHGGRSEHWDYSPDFR